MKTVRLTSMQGFIPAELPPPNDAPELPEKHDVSFVPARTVNHSAVFEDAEAGKVLGRAEGLYDKHLKYGSDWNPWHPFANAFDYQQARALSTQKKKWVDDYLRVGLDCFQTTSFQSASELWELLRGLDFGLGSDSWLEAAGYHGTIYCRDIFVCMKFLLGHLAFAEDLDFAPVQLFDSADNRIYTEMNSGDWWWETQEHLPNGASIIPIILASDKTHLTNFSGDKSAWPLYMSIGNIHKDVRRTASRRAWILVGFIPVPPKGAPDSSAAWHHAVHTIIGALKEVKIDGPGYQWDCADGFLRRCYPILAAWIGDYPEISTLTQIIGGACPVCEIPKGIAMGHDKQSRKFKPRCVAEYQGRLDDCADELKQVHLQPMSNLFWDYPLCDVYRLWQPDTLHQLYLGIVKDLFQWVTGYMKIRGMKEEFDARFTSVPHYPNMLRFNKPFDALKNGTWQGKEIREMLRSLGAVCAPLLSSDAPGKTSTERASDIEVMKTIRALVEFTLLSRQRAHSRISLKHLQESLERFYRCKVVFAPQRASSARKARLEKDFSIQATEAKKEAMNKFESSLQSRVYKATAAQQRVFQVRLKEELEVLRIWSEPDKAFAERELDRSIFGATEMKRGRFEELYGDSLDRLESRLRAGASRGPKSKFASDLAKECLAIKTAVYGRSRVTTAAIAEYNEQLSIAEKKATDITDDRLEQTSHRVEVEVFGVGIAEQAAFKEELNVQRRQFEQDWEFRKGPALQKRLESEYFHFGKPKMHLLSHYQEFISRMGAPDNFSTDISELLHISNGKAAYRASNRVNFLLQILAHNDRHTALDYMHMTLRWLALKGWYDKDTATTLNLINASEKRRCTRHAQQNRILAGEPEPFFRPNLPPSQPYQLSSICARSPVFKRMSVAQAAVFFDIPTLPTLVRHHLNQIWGHDAVGLLWGAGDDFKHEVEVLPYNKVRFYANRFHTPLDHARGLLDCSVQNVSGCIYKRPPQVVWERLDGNTSDGLRGRRPAFPLLYFSFSPPLKVLDIQDVIRKSGGSLKLFSKFIPSLRAFVARPSALGLAAAVGTGFQHRLGNPEVVDGYIRVIKAAGPHVFAVDRIEGPCHLLPVSRSTGSGSVWIINNHVDLDTYWDVY